MAPVVALAGFMGSGKTTVGRKTAQLLDWEFVDLDARIEAASGRTIPSLFADAGEPSFRRMESEVLVDVLEEAAGKKGLVLALGGGTLTNSDSLAQLKERALVVYLQVSADQAWSRVSGSDRPLARDRRTFVELLAKRRHIYEAAADHIVATRGRGSDVIAREVAAVVQAHLGGAG